MYNLLDIKVHNAQELRLKKGKKFELGYVKAHLQTYDTLLQYNWPLEKIDEFKQRRKRLLDNV